MGRDEEGGVTARSLRAEREGRQQRERQGGRKAPEGDTEAWKGGAAGWGGAGGCWRHGRVTSGVVP